MREIHDFYSREYDEDARLATGIPRFEFERSKDIIGRLLPAAGGAVLDIGGGTGHYAFWLAGLGFRATLVDLVERHIDIARARAVRGGPAPVAMVTGDARRLDAPDASADLVLLMGPLYHLTERSDRLAALREARRVARPGAAVAAAAISRYASLLDGFHSGHWDSPAFAAMVERDLADGQHRNPEGGHWFTTAFFHHPAELAAEMAEAGWPAPELLAVEGPIGLLPALDGLAPGHPVFDTAMRFARRIERDPSLLGATWHLLGVAYKPAR